MTLLYGAGLLNLAHKIYEFNGYRAIYATFEGQKLEALFGKLAISIFQNYQPLQSKKLTKLVLIIF